MKVIDFKVKESDACVCYYDLYQNGDLIETGIDYDDAIKEIDKTSQDYDMVIFAKEVEFDAFGFYYDVYVDKQIMYVSIPEELVNVVVDCLKYRR